MSQRTQLIIVLVLLVLGVSIFFGVMTRKKTAAIPAPIATTTHPAVTSPSSAQAPAATPPTEPQKAPSNAVVAPLTDTPEQSDLKTTAAVFAEFFGSYSSPNDFTSFSSVSSLSTPTFAATLPALRAELAKSPLQIASKSLVTKIKSQDATHATVEVLTQRTKFEKGASTTFQQRIVLTLVKDGAAWRVDSAVWNATTF